MADRNGVRTVELDGVMDAHSREVLSRDLGAVFCDELVGRGGWGWLCPDVRITLTEGRDATHWRLHVWDVGERVTDRDWVAEQVRGALENTSLNAAPEALTGWSDNTP